MSKPNELSIMNMFLKNYQIFTWQCASLHNTSSKAIFGQKTNTVLVLDHHHNGLI